MEFFFSISELIITCDMQGGKEKGDTNSFKNLWNKAKSINNSINNIPNLKLE